MRRSGSLLLFAAAAVAGALEACGGGASPDGSAALEFSDGGYFRDAEVTSLDGSLLVVDARPDEKDATDGPPADAEAPADAATDTSPPVDAGVDALVTACTRTLTIATVTASPSGCALNENVTSTPATLSFPCAGGAATATFGKQTFRGTVQNGQVGLSNVDEFVYGGCTYQSTQTLEGKLTGPLTYKYSETTPCADAGTCKGSGSCTVQ